MLLGKGADWWNGPCVSPQPFASSSDKWLALAWTCLHCVDGDIAKAKKAWLSLLCPAQYLMIDRDAKNDPGGLVLSGKWEGTLVHIFSTGCCALGLARN